MNSDNSCSLNEFIVLTWINTLGNRVTYDELSRCVEMDEPVIKSVLSKLWFSGLVEKDKGHFSVADIAALRVIQETFHRQMQSSSKSDITKGKYAKLWVTREHMQHLLRLPQSIKIVDVIGGSSLVDGALLVICSSEDFKLVAPLDMPYLTTKTKDDGSIEWVIEKRESHLN